MIDALQSWLTPEVVTVLFIGGIAGLGLVLGLLALGPLTLEVMYSRFY